MYKLTNDNSIIIRISDGAYVPNDQANEDYKAYLQWLSEGNTPDPIPLQTKTQKIAALNAEYDIKFQSLQRAYASAGLANNGALTIAQKQDSLTQQNLTLIAEKTSKLEAIRNG